MDLHLDSNNEHGCPLQQKCPFAFVGCQFESTGMELETHSKKYVKHHLLLVGQYLYVDHQTSAMITSEDCEVIKQVLFNEVDKTNKKLYIINAKDRELALQLAEFQDKQGVEALFTSLRLVLMRSTIYL